MGSVLYGKVRPLRRHCRLLDNLAGYCSASLEQGKLANCHASDQKAFLRQEYDEYKVII